MKLRRRRRVKAFPQKRSQLGGCGLLPGIWVQGFARPVRLAGQRLRRRPDKCDAGCRPSGRRISRSAASGRTRSLCRSSSSHRNRFAGFRREPCWEVIKAPVLHFFSVPAWGWYHHPRRAIHAVETLDARRSQRRIRRFYAAAVLALCGLNLPSSGTHATPAPNRAHSGSHAETRGVFTARDIARVDRVNSLGTLCIVTFGTVQLNEPLAVAAAYHGGNADFA